MRYRKLGKYMFLNVYSYSVRFTPNTKAQRCCRLPCEANPDSSLLKCCVQNLIKLANFIQLDLWSTPYIR